MESRGLYFYRGIIIGKHNQKLEIFSAIHSTQENVLEDVKKELKNYEVVHKNFNSPEGNTIIIKTISKL